MIKLSKRLESISSLVPIKSKVIDIGCDHGLLDIYLFENNISTKIIASDINENALSSAKHNIKKYKLEKNIETRLGNGLDTLNENDNVDTIIISGMGAHTIINILKDNYQKLKNIDNIIIQSNTKIELLRKEITKLHYIIDDELIVEDKSKIYTIIKFIKGDKKYSQRELILGPILMKKNDKLFIHQKEIELTKLKMLLKSLPKSKIIERIKIKKKISIYK